MTRNFVEKFLVIYDGPPINPLGVMNRVSFGDERLMK